MAWTIEFEAMARRQFGKLPRKAQQRLRDFIDDRLAPAANPRRLGLAMSGPFAGHWRFRVGDYRLIARIEDARVLIVVVAIGNRREVYR